MSLLMPEKTGLVAALVVKTAYVLFPSFWFYKRYLCGFYSKFFGTIVAKIV